MEKKTASYVRLEVNLDVLATDLTPEDVQTIVKLALIQYLESTDFAIQRISLLAATLR